MADKVLGVGVIGAGVGSAHIAAYKQIPRVEVRGLAGLDDDRVKQVAEKYNVPRTFREFADLLQMSDIDAVSIAVPNALHAQVAIAALESGKHVLVEKPLARNAEEGRRMVAAAQSAGKTLMVSFNHRYRGDVQWVKRYVETGALGQIYYAKAHWMRRAGIPHLGSWFVSKEHAGGGPLIDLGVHVLDMALYIMGEPRPLTVSASTYAEFGPRGMKGWGDPAGVFSGNTVPYEVEDLGSAFIRLNDGSTLLLEASWGTHSSAGDDIGLTLYGSNGGVELLARNYSQQNSVRAFADVAGAQVEITPNTPSVEGHRAVVERFVNAILDGAPAIPSANDGLSRTEILDACYRSAAAGCEINMEEISK